MILGAKSEMAISTAKLYAKNGWDLILVGRRVTEILLLFKNELEKEFNCTVNLFDLDIFIFIITLLLS